MGKTTTTVHLTAEGFAFLRALKRYHGVAQTAIVEMAIREKAQRDLLPSGDTRAVVPEVAALGNAVTLEEVSNQ
jgi:hypothetical protein